MLKPWGWYFVLYSGAQFKIKLLYFKPSGKISYQLHNNRSELWLFLFGRGLMRAGLNQYFLRQKGETYLVNKGHWHQYKAHRKTLVLEIQFGGACNEDDIIRNHLAEWIEEDGG